MLLVDTISAFFGTLVGYHVIKQLHPTLPTKGEKKTKNKETKQNKQKHNKNYTNKNLNKQTKRNKPPSTKPNRFVKTARKHHLPDT